jgi:hypothetical protein
MAESTLSIKFSDLQAEVAGFLGYGVDPAAWTAAKSAEIDRFVQSGVRQFYYPPAVNGAEAGYEWSFLKPVASLNTVANDGAYDLPDDLGRVLGDLHFAASVHASSIVVVSEARMLAFQDKSVDAGRPQYAAVRSKTSDGTTGQRQELVLWPVPNAIYALAYRYEAYAGKLTSSKQYPLGGMRHSELIVESCLSIAEQRANDEKGLHGERFSALLVTGIAQDRKAGARFFGQMGSPESSSAPSGRPFGSHYDITYKGETW